MKRSSDYARRPGPRWLNAPSGWSRGLGSTSAPMASRSSRARCRSAFLTAFAARRANFATLLHRALARRRGAAPTFPSSDEGNESTLCLVLSRVFSIPGGVTKFQPALARVQRRSTRTGSGLRRGRLHI